MNLLLSVITVYLYSEDYPVSFYSWIDSKFNLYLVFVCFINLFVTILLFTCLFSYNKFNSESKRFLGGEGAWPMGNKPFTTAGKKS